MGIATYGDWLGHLRGALKDTATYQASTAGDGPVWRNGYTRAQGRYLKFTEELLYGTVGAIETFPGLRQRAGPHGRISTIIAEGGRGDGAGRDGKSGGLHYREHDPASGQQVQQ